jgi:hypothetical protein
MRTVRHVVLLTCVLFCAFQTLATGQLKYGVKVGTVKPAALTKARTYTWTVSRPAFNKKVDAMIVAAIERELLARGLTKTPTGPGDVTVAYSSIGRTDVDTKDAPKDNAAREFDVGTLVVNMTNPTSRELLFQVRVDTPFQRDLATLEGEINAAVAALFGKYPAPPKR